MNNVKPTLKPMSPFFSSGPCAKPQGWSLARLEGALLGRSHRSKEALARLQETLRLTKEVLAIPEEYRVLFVAGSATGAVECALWSFLGIRPVTALAWDIFGARWQWVIKNALKIKDQVMVGGPTAPFPDLSTVNFDHDVLFTWNGSTAGMCVPGGDWIPESRTGLTLCDATSAVFAMPLDWEKLDVTAFPWQKGLGAEANQGVLVLSPRAVTHLNTHPAQWPVPYMFSLRGENGLFNEELCAGVTLNTPSLLCLEDYRQGLLWAKELGGLEALVGRTTANNKILEAWLGTQDWIAFAHKEPEIRSTTTVCLVLTDPRHENKWEPLKEMASLLAHEEVGFDLLGHGAGTPCLRLWCGPTIDPEDISRLCTWLLWAYQQLETR